MGKIANLKGKKINSWKFLEFVEVRQHDAYWKVQCECGNIKTRRAKDIKQHRSKSCGCKKNQSRRKEMVGKKFGKLEVLAFSHHDKHGAIHYVCECQCGNRKTVHGNSLRRGVTQSCGCLMELAKLKQQRKFYGKIKPCKIKDCSEKSNCKGFCKSHYNQYYKGLIDIDGNKARESRAKPIGPDQCKFPGCEILKKDQGTLRKGLCTKHYKWLTKKIIDEDCNILDPERIPKKKPTECKVCGSTNMKGRGFCKKHYKDYYRGRLTESGEEIQPQQNRVLELHREIPTDSLC